MEGNSRPPSASSTPPAPRLGAWNFYFLAKFLLFWRELIGLHPLENLAFAALLLIPLRSAGQRLLRNVLAVPAAVTLLYYDSWLPPAARLFSQAHLLSHFSPAYLFELAGRFVSWPVVAALIVLGVSYAAVARYLRVGVLVIGALVAMLPFHDPERIPGTVSASASGGPNAANLDMVLQAFHANESRRGITFIKPDAAAPPFDLLFIHACSLSWDDLEAVGMDKHPLWQNFDIVLRRFNSAASYSGPAAIRFLRATCGQQAHSQLYSPAPENCYLMPSLEQAGFETSLAFNHDGHFDDFLSFVRQQGITAVPLPLAGIAAPLRAFDDSAIHDDLAVLSRWLELRRTMPAPRVAAYYNTVSLHDGNRPQGSPPGPGSLDTYKTRLLKFLDDIDGFIGQVERAGRRVVIVLVPEHGAAIRGDKMQIAGLREIATPAITQVPVGIRVVGPEVRRTGGRLDITDSVSYLALSHIVARMLEKPPYGADGFSPKDVAAGLPITEFVAENNQSVMLRHGDRYFLRPDDKAGWKEYAAAAR
ncbi:MAG TPA: cellulose biosynthesis protein BcsG [Paucimonas sp.]|nr:cellulose biosynthesis protein BcsG [Paucimonas sp.]